MNNTPLQFQKETNQFVFVPPQQHLAKKSLIFERQRNGNRITLQMRPVLQEKISMFIGQNPFIFCYNKGVWQIQTPPDWTDHYKQCSPSLSCILGQWNPGTHCLQNIFMTAEESAQKRFHFTRYSILSVHRAFHFYSNKNNIFYKDIIAGLEDFLDDYCFSNGEISYLQERNIQSPLISRILLAHKLGGKGMRDRKIKM